MRSVRDRAAKAQVFNAAFPPHTHPPAVDPAKAVSQYVRTQHARNAAATKAIKHQKDHQATAAQLDDIARQQDWGRRTSSETSLDGRHFYKHESPTHDTEVIHRGSETSVYRKHLSPPANAHAAQRAALEAGSGERWGRRVAMHTTPSGQDVHTFQDATHRTTVIHRGGEIITHRKPNTP